MAGHVTEIFGTPTLRQGGWCHSAHTSMASMRAYACAAPKGEGTSITTPLLMYQGEGGKVLGTLILGHYLKRTPPPWDIKLGDVYFIKMLDFCYGCGLRRSKVFSFYAKSDCFLLFLVVGRPQGQKVGAFWSKNHKNR